MKSMIYTSFSLEGLHFWKDCDIKEVHYLKFPHRHLFGFKCYVDVNHGDRDVEFIEFKHKIINYLEDTYWDFKLNLLNFRGRSCEMLAEELIEKFDLCKCEVNEDGENGAILEKDSK